MIVVQEKLQKIWKIINLYTNKYIYNIDKSTLFWNIALDRTLDTEQNTKKSTKRLESLLILYAILVDLTNSSLGLLEKPKYFIVLAD